MTNKTDERVNDEFLDKLFSFLKRINEDESGACFGAEGYLIVDEPLGTKQDIDPKLELPKEYAFLIHEYCDQWRNGGYSGDSFAGDLYYPLPNGKYMKIEYCY